jgi:Fe(3+) dicitrate transport protein
VDDRLRIRRHVASATHDVTLGAGPLRTTAYGYTTSRDWQRQNYGYTPDASGIVLLPTTGNRNRSFEVFGIEPRLQLGYGLGGIRAELEAGARAQRVG